MLRTQIFLIRDDDNDDDDNDDDDGDNYITGSCILKY